MATVWGQDIKVRMEVSLLLESWEGYNSLVCDGPFLVKGRIWSLWGLLVNPLFT